MKDSGALGPVLVVDDQDGFGTSLGRGGSYVNMVNDKRVADEIFSSIIQNPKGVDPTFSKDLHRIIP